MLVTGKIHSVIILNTKQKVWTFSATIVCMCVHVRMLIVVEHLQKSSYVATVSCLCYDEVVIVFEFLLTTHTMACFHL